MHHRKTTQETFARLAIWLPPHGMTVGPDGPVMKWPWSEAARRASDALGEPVSVGAVQAVAKAHNASEHPSSGGKERGKAVATIAAVRDLASVILPLVKDLRPEKTEQIARVAEITRLGLKKG